MYPLARICSIVDPNFPDWGKGVAETIFSVDTVDSNDDRVGDGDTVGDDAGSSLQLVRNKASKLTMSIS